MLAWILKAIRWGIPVFAIKKELIDSKALGAADDYSAENVMSEGANVATPFRFVGAARKNGRGGTIKKAQAFLSVNALAPRIVLDLYSARPTTLAVLDRAATTAPLTADLGIYQGSIDFMAMTDRGGESMALVTPSTVGNVPLDYICVGTDLYGIAATLDAITGEAVGMKLTFKLTVEQD